MQSALVVAYPKISEGDYKWIQSIREKYDERYFGMIEPHFTIVFPVLDYEVEKLYKHVIKSCRYLKPINFVIRESITVKDSLSEYTDVFLIPDEGKKEITGLQDKLYTGLLADQLRADISYIPHIGVGASEDSVEAEKISGKLNRERIFIKGAVDELEILEYDYPAIRAVYKIPLKLVCI